MMPLRPTPDGKILFSDLKESSIVSCDFETGQLKNLTDRKESHHYGVVAKEMLSREEDETRIKIEDGDGFINFGGVILLKNSF